MEGKSIILVKERSYFPTGRTRDQTYSLFYFKNPQVFFNIFFQKAFMNRVDESTRLAYLTDVDHKGILEAWARSVATEDTIFDSSLPYPNTRNYVWGDTCVNQMIQVVRIDHRNQKKPGRPYFKPLLKTRMMESLLCVDHYNLEIYGKTLHEAMASTTSSFSEKFRMPKQMKASVINNTDYSKQQLDLDIVGAITIFAEEIESINEPSRTPLNGESLRSEELVPNLSTKTNRRPPTPYPNHSSSSLASPDSVSMMSSVDDGQLLEDYASRKRKHEGDDGSREHVSPIFSPLQSPTNFKFNTPIRNIGQCVDRGESVGTTLFTP